MKFLLISCLLITAGSSTLFAQFSLRGELTDVTTKQPVPGAVVSIHGSNRNALSDDDGRFEFSDMTAGTYVLAISHVSYEATETTVRLEKSHELVILLTPGTLMAEEVIVNATRATINTPITYSELDKQEISELNTGQDLPYVLNFTPSVVTTSDAGAGIGYTGLRIRGSDATRINVTINGVPLNDSEGQNVFWVDIPDFASSTESIQIQRGVGTSTNGAGAFGGTINLQTLHSDTKAYGELINGWGSFNTHRHTLRFGTGLINGHWSVDGRLSKIKSDGYIDRATSDLDSYYFSAGFFSDKTIVKAIAFGGHERTYQAWYGTPQAVLENDPEGIEAVIINNGLDEAQAENMRTAGRTFNWYLYDDQVDDYGQNHYQLHASHRFSSKFTMQLTGHYTKGKGYYEQYERDAAYSDYGLPDITVGDSTITGTDLVQRRWLDNDFYGVTFSLDFAPSLNSELILGGAWNTYDGGHFGEVIWTETAAGNVPKDYRYYDNDGNKTDFNLYVKYTRQIRDKWNIFGDLQYRGINYDVYGIDNDLRELAVEETYNFFNPKVGASFNVDDRNIAYASFAVANREPVRTDFIDSDELPSPERLYNLEAGFRHAGSRFSWEGNLYYMKYRDQLVLTGALNDVGSSLRTNVNDSYRLGIELVWNWKVGDRINWQANATFSRNKIAKFTEVIYDYGVNWDEYNKIEINYEDTDISFSPNVIAGSELSYQFARNIFLDADYAELSLLSKYVGAQYLDNTTNDNRKVDAYFINDLRFRYFLSGWVLKGLDFSVVVNNIFGVKYSSNGYTFGYQAGPDYVVRENYYYPQALQNFIATLAVRF